MGLILVDDEAVGAVRDLSGLQCGSEGFPADGEGLIREVMVDPFYMDTYSVTLEAGRTRPPQKHQ